MPEMAGRAVRHALVDDDDRASAQGAGAAWRLFDDLWRPGWRDYRAAVLFCRWFGPGIRRGVERGSGGNSRTRSNGIRSLTGTDNLTGDHDRLKPGHARADHGTRPCLRA